MISLPNFWITHKSSFLTTFLISFTIACSTSDLQVSPQQFWEAFRQAAIANDTKYLIDNTHFPLELKSVDDSQPVVLYGKDQFKDIFDKVLNQSVVVMEGDDAIIKTTKDIIKSSKELSVEHLTTKDLFRVDQLLFEFKNNQWHLVRVYLEE